MKSDPFEYAALQDAAIKASRDQETASAFPEIDASLLGAENEIDYTINHRTVDTRVPDVASQPQTRTAVTTSPEVINEKLRNSELRDAKLTSIGQPRENDQNEDQTDGVKSGSNWEEPSHSGYTPPDNRPVWKKWFGIN